MCYCITYVRLTLTSLTKTAKGSNFKGKNAFKMRSTIPITSIILFRQIGHGALEQTLIKQLIINLSVTLSIHINGRQYIFPDRTHIS
jgi:glycopeptide antibiotics resistance protein